MFNIRLYSLAFFLMYFYHNASYAQNNEITIVGEVLENHTNLPIEYATIALLDNDSKQAITGTITAEDGTFSLKTEASNFYFEISFIGYATNTISTYNTVNNKIDLKTILLDQALEDLDEVIIRAEKSQTVFKLDKRIFNVGTDLSSSGASALEV